LHGEVDIVADRGVGVARTLADRAATGEHPTLQICATRRKAVSYLRDDREKRQPSRAERVVPYDLICLARSTVKIEHFLLEDAHVLP
jgi:hypothetical protein